MHEDGRVLFELCVASLRVHAFQKSLCKVY